MPILLKNAQKKIPIQSARLRERVQSVLDNLNLHKVELSILLTNDEKIRELNYNYREKDRATDVLSFPQDEDAVNENGERLLGDVAISLETAGIQAKEHHLDLDQEIVLLIIHGVLHLMGYDHDRSEEEDRIMRQETARVFGQVFPGVQVSASCDF